MSVLPLGIGAYKRTRAAAPEVKLINRYVEQAPTNQKEHIMLLARSGTNLLHTFPADTNKGKVRECFSETGIFGSDLFVVSGKNLYRYDGTTRTHILGEILGDGAPKAAFVKGAGYERVFIADGLLLSYYEGGTGATGTLTRTDDVAATGTCTYDGSGSISATIVEAGGVYYGWNSSNVDFDSPDGSQSHPWLCLTGADVETSLANMADMINFTGTAGTDFSTDLTEHNQDASATSTATTLVATARTVGNAGNLVTTSVVGSNLAWGGTTLSGGDQIENYNVVIGGVYYGWNATDVDAGDPAGTSTDPFLCDPGTDAIEAMANMLNFIGTRGTDFSTALTSANLQVSAASVGDVLTVTSRGKTAAANDITTTVDGTGTLLAWADTTLTGGGVHSLHGVDIPNGEAVAFIASLNGFVLVGCVDSQKFYFLRPGEVEIDALDFASKESSPDAIVDMQRVGDSVVIMGSASTEFWAATGDSDAPFAPVQGRTLSRGCIPGTAVMVTENTIIVVGNDMRVYTISGQIAPVSDHGMEERIRRQMQREGAAS